MFLFSWNAGSVNSISHLFFVLKLPALVDHLVDLCSVFFQCLTNLLLIKVAPQPESNSTLNLWFSPALSGRLFLIYPSVIVDKSSTLVLFLGRNISAVEARHSIVCKLGLLPLNLLILTLLSSSTGVLHKSSSLRDTTSSFESTIS